jgi:hypothetical protein
VFEEGKARPGSTHFRLVLATESSSINRIVVWLRVRDTFHSAEFGISRKTGYKIFDCYNDCGVQAFSDRSHRAHRQANRLPAPIKATIVRLKREYPGWGAQRRSPIGARPRCGTLRGQSHQQQLQGGGVDDGLELISRPRLATLKKTSAEKWNTFMKRLVKLPRSSWQIR